MNQNNEFKAPISQSNEANPQADESDLNNILDNLKSALNKSDRVILNRILLKAKTTIEQEIENGLSADEVANIWAKIIHKFLKEKSQDYRDKENTIKKYIVSYYQQRTTKLPSEKENYLDNREYLSIKMTSRATAIFVILSMVSFLIPMNASISLLIHATSVGALGGLAHEFAQSGGRVLFFKKNEDGLYLGSIAGMILGAVAGLLVVRSYIPEANLLQVKEQNQNNLQAQVEIKANNQGSAWKLQNLDFTLEVFFAGLALKGITEAATGNQVQVKSKTEESASFAIATETSNKVDKTSSEIEEVNK